jgi:hypothetical protein
MEPLYEKWLDVPQMLTAHLQRRAYDGDKLALKVIIKVREFEKDQGDHSPGSTGDTNPASQRQSRLLHLPVDYN